MGYKINWGRGGGGGWEELQRTSSAENEDVNLFLFLHIDLLRQFPRVGLKRGGWGESGVPE